MGFIPKSRSIRDVRLKSSPSNYGDDFNENYDPNAWNSADDTPDPDEDIDWMERLSGQSASWETSYDDNEAEFIPNEKQEVDQDDSEVWLDALQSIAADEVNFINKESDRAEKALQMQEMGFSKEAIEETLGVATDTSQELDAEEDAVFQQFQEETKKSGFGMVVDDVDEDFSTIESHTKVEIDEETGEPIRSEMIYVDEHACVGCTHCAMIAQSTFFMDDEHGRARVFQQWGDDDDTIQAAIDTCPVDCIHYVPFEELRRLEIERRGQNINFKARLVNGQGANSHQVGGAVAFTAPQKIAETSKKEESEEEENARIEKERLKELRNQREKESKSANL